MKTKTNLLNNAKNLRKGMTDAERYLWYRLRRNNFFGLKFKRQVPMSHYIVDFVCFEKNIIIEIDGGQHSEQEVYDACRTQYLESKGFKVLRFWNNEMLGNVNGVLEVVMRELGVGQEE
jgi:very-short-patch-repair endonuclease